MNHQLTFPPATHTHDPPPSAQAERRITASGKRQKHCMRVLSAVQRYPRMTAVELAPWVGMEMHEVRRRLSDLHSAGAIHIYDRRLCREAGTLMSTWEIST